MKQLDKRYDMKTVITRGEEYKDKVVKTHLKVRD